MAEETRGHRKRLVGRVISDKMQKTVTVQVEGLRKDPRYEKFIVRSQTYKAHDEENTCRAGDRVVIEETRPLSREKRWKVKQILERAR